MGQGDDPFSRNIEDTRGAAARGTVKCRDGIILVDELQSCVVAQDGRHHGEGEVLGHGRLDARANDIGKSQDGHGYIRAATCEPSDVALNLDRVLGPSGRRRVLRRHVFGEERRITGACSINRRGRLHDDASHRWGLLARGEQLHRPDDVDLFHRCATAGLHDSRDDSHVNHGVNIRGAEHLADHGIANIGTDEFSPG